MEALVWIGAAVSLAGLAGIVGCIVAVARARRGADEEALRAAVRRVLPWNLGAFLLSMTGLILVIVGVILA
jgi:hypothetical protein